MTILNYVYSTTDCCAYSLVIVMNIYVDEQSQDTWQVNPWHPCATIPNTNAQCPFSWCLHIVAKVAVQTKMAKL